MSKPDWKDAPEWANHLAQDENGGWYWFENKPSIGSAGNWNCRHGDCENAKSIDDWDQTLESSP